MCRTNFRVILGGALIFLGLLMLLERVGILRGATDVFWGVLLLGAGAFFLYRFATASQAEWWAAIPGSALVGLGIQSLLPRSLEAWDGLFFLGLLGLGFWAVYFTDRERWWAIIPGGVLVTLGSISVLGNLFGDAPTGGFFFLGLGLTFLLVAVLAAMQWAYIPAAVLILMGVVVGTPFSGALDFVWPVVLVGAGLILIYRFYRAH